MRLKIEISENLSDIVVNLQGDLDINTNEDFKSTVIAKIVENKNMIFNCEELAYIDSVGLGAFISVYKKLKEKKATLTIRGLKSHIKKIFVITDLDKVFKIEE